MAVEDRATHERIEGPTPAGGTHALACYRDATGAPTPKSAAVQVEVLEFDAAGRCIARTHATLTQPEVKP